MDFDITSLAVIFATSGLGYVYLSYGRRMSKAEMIFCGVALMAYPYFVSGWVFQLAVGLVLGGLPFLFRWW